MTELQKSLERLLKPGTYGHLELDISDGEIAIIRETITRKLISRMGHTRSNDKPKQ